jgi:hypothetical protein
MRAFSGSVREDERAVLSDFVGLRISKKKANQLLWLAGPGLLTVRAG